jgi:hypothetical protein
MNCLENLLLHAHATGRVIELDWIGNDVARTTVDPLLVDNQINPTGSKPLPLEVILFRLSMTLIFLSPAALIR